MPRNITREAPKPEKELKVVLKILRNINNSSVASQFALHRLASLAQDEPLMVPIRVANAISIDTKLARSLASISRTLEGPVMKIDPEIEQELTSMPLSGKQILSAVFQAKLRIRSTVNEKTIKVRARMEDPRKTTEKLETGSTSEWTGMGRRSPNDQ